MALHILYLVDVERCMPRGLKPPCTDSPPIHKQLAKRLCAPTHSSQPWLSCRHSDAMAHPSGAKREMSRHPLVAKLMMVMLAHAQAAITMIRRQLWGHLSHLLQWPGGSCRICSERGLSHLCAWTCCRSRLALKCLPPPTKILQLG